MDRPAGNPAGSLNGNPSADRPRRTAEATKAAILGAARTRFAQQGYERTTIRAVAADAGIDASMVMRYFGSKEQLFDAALAVDLNLPDLRDVPADRLPALLVRHFLSRWEGEPPDEALAVLLRSAVTNDQAAARMRDIFARQVAPALGAVMSGPDAPARAALVAAQLLGLLLSRNLVRFPAAAGLTPDEVERLYAPALAAVLTA